MVDEPTPEQLARQEAEETGVWPHGSLPYHRHFASSAVHRDGHPECDQQGAQRRVWVFDTYALEAHEAFITERTRRECQGGNQD